MATKVERVLAEAIDAEGGVVDAMEWGISAVRFGAGGTELGDAYEECRAAYQKMRHLITRVGDLMDFALEEPEGDD